jgi:NTP pyrophosphatase (non-canonical NTP hydrolase)
MLDNQIEEIMATDQANEVMDILQEEAAEVIQGVSKVRRFGPHNHKLGETQTNLEHLEEELGDMLAMIDIMLEMGMVSSGNLEVAKRAKIEKLKKWSNIKNLSSFGDK